MKDPLKTGWPDAGGQMRRWARLCRAVPWLRPFVNGQSTRPPNPDDHRAYTLWLLCDTAEREAVKAILSGEVDDDEAIAT